MWTSAAVCRLTLARWSRRTQETEAALAAASRDFNALAHSTQALEANLAARQAKLEDEEARAADRLRAEDFYVSSTKDGVLSAAQLDDDLGAQLMHHSIEAEKAKAELAQARRRCCARAQRLHSNQSLTDGSALACAGAGRAGAAPGGALEGGPA